jgi:hypothetical protein
MNLARITCVVLLSSVLVSAQAKDPVAGAWERTVQKNLTTGEMQRPSNPPLRIIYANGYYVQFTAEADRNKTEKPNSELTKDEMADRLRMQGQSGTYRVEGARLTKKVISAAAPVNEGREGTSDFRIEGDLLITTSVNAQGQKIEARYRKLK